MIDAMPLARRPLPFSVSTLAAIGGLIADVGRYGGRRLAAAIALMLAGGVLEGIGLAMLVPILALLAPGAGGRWQEAVTGWLARLGIEGRTGQLTAVLAAFCLLVGVRAGVLTARDRLSRALNLGYVDHRRLEIVTDLARARWAALARLRHARIVHILSVEINRLDTACAIILHMAAAGVMLGVQAGLMIALSPAIAGFAVGLALLGLLVLAPLARRAAAVGKRISRYQFRISGEAAHFLGGLKLAVAHDMAGAFVARVQAESAALRAEREDNGRFQSRVAIASASIASLVGAGMILGAVLLRVPVVQLLAGIAVLVRMSGPVRTLQMDVQQLFGVLPAFTVLRELQDDLGAAVPTAIGGGQALPRGTIRFEGVTFRYPGMPTPVFKKLELELGLGEVVGLSGPSGTGKTTLVDLLTGLLDPTEGRIAIGDGAARETLRPNMLADWRRRLAYVPQDSYLTNDSIRNNLTWNAASRPDADLWAALDNAGARALVRAMPDGLDTVVDERGTRLSGGERQRIALARAILRSPDLLILDEATNAIDAATERTVLSGLRRVLPYATILLIAHREETLAACDRVVVLRPGEQEPMHRSIRQDPTNCALHVSTKSEHADER